MKPQSCSSLRALVTSLAGLFLATLFATAQTTSTWTGSANNAWDNPSNWNPYGVPPVDAVVVINSGSPNAAALGAFTQHGVNLNGGTLTANGLSVSELNQSGGSLAGTNTIGAGGRWSWRSGWLYGVLTIENGATAEFITASDKWFADGAELHNHGEIIWTGGRLMGYRHYGPATLRNHAGARFVAAGGTGMANQFGNYEGRFILEAGAEFLKQSGADITCNWRLQNAGALAVNAGILRWNAGGASSGLFTNQAGAALVFSGGTHTLAGGTQLLGDGNFQVAWDTVTASGVVTHGRADSPGVLELVGG
ncbi:MAG: hypothetical protein HZA90_04030, partial [Verrucomicrobia bacterium]|nr:hypothetical protein [Verrucomicrobiota bacterium]